MGYAMKNVDLRGDVGDVSIKGLIDTGSPVTIVCNDIAKNLEMHGLGPVHLLAPRGESILGFYVYGTIRVVGTKYTARLKLTVLNKMLFSMDCLLGLDFIGTAKMNANLQQLEGITCDKCGSPIEKCACTWLPFKLLP